MKYITVAFSIIFFFSQDMMGQFELVAPSSSGISFQNIVKESHEWNLFTYLNIYNGGGVAAGDLDNDGLPELYFTGNMVPDRLYQNKGSLQFEDITETSGVFDQDGWTTGVTFADVNGDGLLDIYVCKAGDHIFPKASRKNKLYINQGELQFKEMATDLGVADDTRSNQATFFDYDQDGDLDLYVANHPGGFRLDIEDRKVKEKLLAMDESDHLYRQEADGSFTNVSKEAGVMNWAFGLGVIASDLNQDGLVDIYVGNDFSERDNYWINQGDGTFKEGLFSSFNHISNFSMGLDVADFNNDQIADMCVLDMVAASQYRKKTNMSGMNPEVFWDNVNIGRHYQYMQNSLQLGNGNGTFSEVAELAGIASTDWSWTSLFSDLDNDGWKDLLISNGMRRDIRNNDLAIYLKTKTQQWVYDHYDSVLTMAPVQPLKNYVFKNDQQLGFNSVADPWGVSYKGFTNGAITSDLDNDGDLDLVFNNLDDVASIYENKLKTGNYLKVRLEGAGKNTAALGAKVYVYQSKGTQLYEVTLTRGFLSSVEPVIHVGLGDSEEKVSVKVIWPNQKESLCLKVEPNKEIIFQEKGTAASSQMPKADPLIFERNLSSGVNYLHRENSFDDFASEILLPYKYSQLGPCLTSGDVNGDGLTDFFVGGAHKTAGALFIQSSDGNFKRATTPAFTDDAEHEDIAAALFDIDGDGDLDLFVGSGSNELEPGSVYYKDRIYLNDGQGNFRKNEALLPNYVISTGAIAPFDWDGDGDMDVFVGGRVVPGNYPYPSASFLLQNDGGTFSDVTNQLLPELAQAGMVTDAAWADMNQDGKVELIISAEWQALRIYEYTTSGFSRMDNTGLEPYTGWWQSLLVTDLNGDQLPDIIAGNLGENSRYHASMEEPFEVFSKDFDGNTTNDIVLAVKEDNKTYPLRGRQCSSQQMPFIKKKFGTYHAFATATVPEIYGKELKDALHYDATTMKSTIFMNKGNGRFEAMPMPRLVQVSAVQAVALADVNKDGKKDILTAGNLYQTEVETPRQDGAIGTVMTMQADGSLVEIPFSRTGWFAHGDIKAMEVITDALGREIIITACNNGPVRVFQIGR